MSNSNLTSMEANSGPPVYLRLSPSKSYALTGKVMLSAIVILFLVVFFMICLHIYTRWYLLRARRRHLQNRQLRRHRRTHLVFYVDPSNPSSAPTQGLDPSVLKSLPVFVYSSQTHPDSLECAVCLSEFQDNETGRLLSKCNHCFHTDCIDMWFHSHSTCPLCRSPVEPAPGPVNPPQIVVSITEEEGRAEPGSSDSESSSSSSAAVGTSATSFGARRKELELAAPGRNPSFGDESGCESPASQTSSFRSPMSRMLSFKRILNRERKSAVSPSGTELDIERGREESQQTQS